MKMPYTRRFGPPQMLIATPPTSMPLPAIESTGPSTDGEAKESTSGVMRTVSIPVVKLLAANRKSKPIRPGRRRRYVQP
jgi:hypothetical protein